jgi:hypothetical protein
MKQVLEDSRASFTCHACDFIVIIVMDLTLSTVTTVIFGPGSVSIRPRLGSKHPAVCNPPGRRIDAALTNPLVHATAFSLDQLGVDPATDAGKDLAGPFVGHSGHLAHISRFELLWQLCERGVPVGTTT